MAICLAILVLAVATVGVIAWRNYSTSLAQYNTPQGLPLTPVWTAQPPFAVVQMKLAPDGRSIYLLGTSSEGCCENQVWHDWLAEMTLGGKLKWNTEIKLPGDRTGTRNLHFGSDGNIYLETTEYRTEQGDGYEYFSDHQRISCYSPSGELRWTVSARELDSQPASSGKVPAVAALAEGAWCYGINQRGQLAWKYQVEEIEVNANGAANNAVFAIPWPAPAASYFLVYGLYGIPKQAVSVYGSQLWKAPAIPPGWPQFRQDGSVYFADTQQNQDDYRNWSVALSSLSPSGALEWSIQRAGLDVTSPATSDGRVYTWLEDSLLCYARDGKRLWRYDPTTELPNITASYFGRVDITNAIDLGEQTLCVEHHMSASPSTGWRLIDGVLHLAGVQPSRTLRSGFYLLDGQGRQIAYFDGPTDSADLSYEAQSAIVAPGLLVLRSVDWDGGIGADRSGIVAFSLPLTPASQS